MSVRSTHAINHRPKKEFDGQQSFRSTFKSIHGAFGEWLIVEIHIHTKHIAWILIATLFSASFALLRFILRSPSWKLTTWWFGGIQGTQLDCNIFAKLLKNSVLILIFFRRKGEQWTRCTNKESRMNDNIVLHLLRQFTYSHVNNLTKTNSFCINHRRFLCALKMPTGKRLEGQIKIFNFLSSKSSASSAWFVLTHLYWN